MPTRRTPASQKLSKDELAEQVREHGPWFHQIDLGQGVRTREVSPSSGPQGISHPLPRWLAIKDSLPPDMSSMSVLDLGCADGFFSVEFARRGARRVLAIDPWSQAVQRVRFVADVLGLQEVVVAQEGSAYDVADLNEKFDIVFALALLYHLEHPLLFLQRVGACTETLYLETLALQNDNDSFLFLRHPSATKTGTQHMPKWIPTRRCLEDMLRWSGFSDVQLINEEDPGRPIYLARKG